MERSDFYVAPLYLWEILGYVHPQEKQAFYGNTKYI